MSTRKIQDSVSIIEVLALVPVLKMAGRVVVHSTEFKSGNTKQRAITSRQEKISQVTTHSFDSGTQTTRTPTPHSSPQAFFEISFAYRQHQTEATIKGYTVPMRSSETGKM